ncbi:2-phospho-L-lactate transferase [Actinotalea sp. C106]|uniref:2-phospho-L-lactate transferase n=1 Tax=Actinotalea sp. C106 TaxID=2908644 RepID=UPI0020295B25|nr:2-phospho-L-lactate transferase [Actinotalea sp. C106]
MPPVTPGPEGPDRSAASAVVTLLAGGVGGAKLAHGFAPLTPDLTVVVNTADDVELHGLAISPDLDTVMYTLAGIANTQAGWGLADETYATLEALGRLGEDTWFTLGDRDLATHIARTSRLRAGARLSDVTRALSTALGVVPTLLPMTDERVATLVDTPAGRLAFQDYFVARGHRDEVLGIVLEGLEHARPAPGVVPALSDADLVVIAPSNPFVSIGPILAVPGIRTALAQTRARRIGVSPVVGGQAIKGPAAAMLASLGHEVSPLGVARLYTDVLDVLCIDHADRALAPAIEDLGLEVLVTDAVMHDEADRPRFARELLVAADLA